ncbi:MAG: hypothetical protein U9R75_01775 [Candidatus Thermoplasmatota archaeon]|nr:hypothetical protein [Candidatus Thermoplasmatota archaeon]
MIEGMVQISITFLAPVTAVVFSRFNFNGKATEHDVNELVSVFHHSFL